MSSSSPPSAAMVLTLLERGGSTASTTIPPPAAPPPSSFHPLSGCETFAKEGGLQGRSSFCRSPLQGQLGGLWAEPALQQKYGCATVPSKPARNIFAAARPDEIGEATPCKRPGGDRDPAPDGRSGRGKAEMEVAAAPRGCPVTSVGCLVRAVCARRLGRQEERVIPEHCHPSRGLCLGGCCEPLSPFTPLLGLCCRPPAAATGGDPSP